MGTHAYRGSTGCKHHELQPSQGQVLVLKYRSMINIGVRMPHRPKAEAAREAGLMAATAMEAWVTAAAVRG